MLHEVCGVLKKSLSSAGSEAAVLGIFAELVPSLIKVDRVEIVPVNDGHGAGLIQTLPFEIAGQNLQLAKRPIPFPTFISDSGRARLPFEQQHALELCEVKSLAIVPCLIQGRLNCFIALVSNANYKRWLEEDKLLALYLSDLLALNLERVSEFGGSKVAAVSAANAAKLGAAEASIERLDRAEDRAASFGKLIIVTTDRDNKVIDVVGDCELLLGVSRPQLISDPSLWPKLVAARDLQRLLKRFRRSKLTEFSEQVELIDPRDGRRSWFDIKAIPRKSEQGAQDGWEVCAIDVSQRFMTEMELRSQNQRIEALYELSRAIQSGSDPNVTVLRGLNALIKATSSDCGFGCLRDINSGSLEISASEGLSNEYIEELSKVVGRSSLARHAADSQKGFLLDDIQQDPRAVVDLARREGLRATIIAPLVAEGAALGVIALFRRSEQKYNSRDFDLVNAACSQIAMAARQAELFAAERRHASSLSALYRLSHELAKQLTVKEVAEHAFPAIQEELACKRIWLGVINDRGTHLAGQAGFGPGIRKHIVELQIELNLRHDFLDDAIRQRRPVVLEGSQEMECSGITRLIKRLRCELLVIIPLVSLRQVVGVLVVEPSVPSKVFIEKRLPLLTTMAAEIAAVIVARRFEARMADADKMRMAGLLASGVAHNFNNLLQAVLGQASLIEVQAAGDQRFLSAARIISEAAAKGAALVKQLFNFSMKGAHAPQSIEIKQMFADSSEMYRSVLGSKVQLEFDIAEDAPEVTADYAQLQQVITNLAINAKEAIGAREDGKVIIRAKRVRLRSGEVDPELAPGVYLQVDVEDNGSGMSPEQCERCFEPFFTTKNVDSRTGIGFGGSGLGLSSAYSILKQHDGIITVQSQVGSGSTFSLYLPAVLEGENFAFGPIDAENAQDGMVLLAAMEPGTALAVRSSFEALGIPVSVLDDPDSIRREFQREPQIERGEDRILVCDVDRLDPRALELFEFQGSSGGAIKLSRRFMLLLTSHPNRWLRVVQSNSGIELVDKPISVRGLVAKIRKILADNFRGRDGRRAARIKASAGGLDDKIVSESSATDSGSVLKSAPQRDKDTPAVTARPDVVR